VIRDSGWSTRTGLSILVTGSARLATLEADAGRWHRQYLDGLIREDILSFENIHQLKAMQLLVDLLRQRVASPVSYQGLSEDLGVSPNTVKHYLEVLEALYIVFRVYPHHRSISRVLVLSLLRQAVGGEDRDGVSRSVRYLRTREGKEVDFVVTADEVPTLMVEVKAQERQLSPIWRRKTKPGL